MPVTSTVRLSRCRRGARLAGLLGLLVAASVGAASGETLPRPPAVTPLPPAGPPVAGPILITPRGSRLRRVPPAPPNAPGPLAPVPNSPPPNSPHIDIAPRDMPPADTSPESSADAWGESSGEASAAPRTLELSPEFQALLTGLVRENLPDKYEDKKKWGQTKDLTVGLRIRHDGLRIKTKRKRKELNHGSWEMYRLELIDPEEDFELRIENLRESADGRLEFDFLAEARFRAFGRWARWQRGVQLISLSADADARVRLRTHCLVAIRLDPTRLPPDVLLEPHVTAADLRLLDFRLLSLSDLKGPLAKQLGRALENVVEDKLEGKRKKLLEKMNRQIEKRRDKLRFSLRDLLNSPWSGTARLLPAVDSGPLPETPDTAATENADSSP